MSSEGNITGSGKLLKEYLGLDDNLGLDEKALEGLYSMLKNRGAMGFLNRTNEPDSDTDEVADNDDDKPTKNRPGHGLDIVCSLYTKGITEEILKLTEVFLPKSEDHTIRGKMEKYNKVRMPPFKDMYEPDAKIEIRKRKIKEKLKEASS